MSIESTDLLVVLAHDIDKKDAPVVVRVGTDPQLAHERRVLERMNEIDLKYLEPMAAPRLRLVSFTSLER